MTLVFALDLAACSVISVDLTPRVRPLEEETVEGRGDAKIVIVELAGVLSDAESAPILSVGNPPARVPLRDYAHQTGRAIFINPAQKVLRKVQAARR